MSGFKIKRPKKPRKPSAKFMAAQAARKEAEAKSVPEEGDVKVYLDDERQQPEGWTLCRTPSQFWNVVKGPASERITHISLDWYLGHNVIADGVKIAETLADMFRNEENTLPSLEIINFHSSDHSKAGEMMRILKPAMEAREDKNEKMAFWLSHGQPHE